MKFIQSAIITPRFKKLDTFFRLAVQQRFYGLFLQKIIRRTGKSGNYEFSSDIAGRLTVFSPSPV